MIDPSVNERVDAYRGNPQGLMQKYSQNANLIDLLALQKLKDEKTAAIREMQLKMAQNGTPPTIGQQREQEVLALTKDEIAKQQADLNNQGQQQQVQQMQQVIGQGMAQQAPAQQARPPQGGLPSMPAPNVMPPKAMAAGGIVHFDGRSGSMVPGMDMPRVDPNAQGLRELGDIREKASAPILKLRIAIGKKLAAGEPLTSQEQAIANRLNITEKDGFAADLIPPSGAKDVGIPTVLPTKTSDAGMTGIPVRKDIGEPPAAEAPAIPANAPAAVKAPPARPAPVRQAVPPTGIATPRPPAAEPSFVPAEARPLVKAAETQMLGELSRDPEADRARYMAEREAAIGKPTMESIAAKQGRVDALRAQDEAANRREKDNQLTEFLLGARGTTLGESLRTAGLAGLNAENRAAAAQRARALEHDKMLTELDAARLAEKETSFTGGRAAAEKTRGDVSLAVKEAGLATNKLLDANIHKLDRDSQERVANLNRASNERIASMQVSAQKSTNDIANAQRRDYQLETLRTRTLQTGLKPLYDQLKGIKGSTVDLGIKPNPAQEKELKAIQDLITLKEKEVNSYYDDLLTKDYSGGSASISTDGKYTVKKVTPPTK
jgi:hypothetical protein